MKTLNVKRDRSTLASLCATNPTDPRCPQAREQFVADGGGGGGGGSRPAQIGGSSIRPPARGSGGEGVPNVIIPPSTGTASKKAVPRSGELPAPGRDVGANERSLRAREQLLESRSGGVDDEDLVRQALRPTQVDFDEADNELVRQALRPTEVDVPPSLTPPSIRTLQPREGGYAEPLHEARGISMRDTRAYNPIAGRYDAGEFQRRLGEIDPTFRENYLRAGDGDRDQWNFLDEEQGFGGQPQPTLPTEAEGVNAPQGGEIGEAPVASVAPVAEADEGLGAIAEIASF